VRALPRQRSSSPSRQHTQFVQAGNGGISLKIEPTKLPEFWDNKTNLTANAFIIRIGEMMGANEKRLLAGEHPQI